MSLIVEFQGVGLDDLNAYSSVGAKSLVTPVCVRVRCIEAVFLSRVEEPAKSSVPIVRLTSGLELGVVEGPSYEELRGLMESSD